MLSSMNLVWISLALVFGAVQGASFKEKGCGHIPADIIFILDESGSIWGPDFKRQLDFVQHVVSSFDVGFNRTHIGVETYGTDTRIIFNLGSITGEKEINDAIKEITQKRGTTRTDYAIKRMREEMFSDDYARSWAHSVCIVITDGESEDPEATAREALLAHELNIKVFAIGVGPSINHKELENIASSDDLVFTVDNYAALETLRSTLAWKACEEPTTPTTTPIPTTPEPTTPAPPQMIVGCIGQKKIDHIWSISDLAGIEGTNNALALIQAVTAEIEISPLQVQVGLTPRRVQEGAAIRLKDHDTKEGFYQSLELRRLESARTDIHISYIRSQGMIAANGGRPDSVKFGVLIIDNKSFSQEKTLAEAKKAKQAGIKLIVIGVGPNVDETELHNLVADPEDLLLAENYADIGDLKSKIIDRLCHGILSTRRDVEDLLRLLRELE